MKFALTMAICSALTGECGGPSTSPFEYKSHYDCAHAGHLTAITIMQNLGSERVNTDHIYIQFKCIEQHNL